MWDQRNQQGDRCDGHDTKGCPQSYLRESAAAVLAHDLFAARDASDQVDQWHGDDAVKDGCEDEGFDWVEADEIEQQSTQRTGNNNYVELTSLFEFSEEALAPVECFGNSVRL